MNMVDLNLLVFNINFSTFTPYGITRGKLKIIRETEKAVNIEKCVEFFELVTQKRTNYCSDFWLPKSSLNKITPNMYELIYIPKARQSDIQDISIQIVTKPLQGKNVLVYDVNSSVASLLEKDILYFQSEFLFKMRLKRIYKTDEGQKIANELVEEMKGFKEKIIIELRSAYKKEIIFRSSFKIGNEAEWNFSALVLYKNKEYQLYYGRSEKTVEEMLNTEIFNKYLKGKSVTPEGMLLILNEYLEKCNQNKVEFVKLDEFRSDINYMRKIMQSLCK